MRLSPRDLDKLALHNAGFLAQKRLARGVRLNYPEAVALIATQILELIRDGRSVAELMDVGRRILGRLFAEHAREHGAVFILDEIKTGLRIRPGSFQQWAGVVPDLTTLSKALGNGWPVAAVVGRREVMRGVPEMIPEVQVEGTFPDGTKLVTVHAPIALETGDLELALYGSFLPVPPAERFARGGEEAAREAARSEGLPAMTFAGTTEDTAGEGNGTPGEVLVKAGEIVLNEGRREVTITVQNKGDRPIQVGSHYPFAETNRALAFDRGEAAGMRLDIPAGAAVRFEPGEQKTVRLVAVAR